MNIAIGKIGKSVIFDRSNWGPSGGDNEAPKIFETLIERNPQHTFIFIGATDLDRCDKATQDRINQHGNVINPWNDERKDFIKSFDGLPDHRNICYIDHFIKKHGITFDAGALLLGPVGTNNVSGKTFLMKENKLASPLMMLARYAGPPISVINEYRFPWVMIVNDPRYLFPWTCRDLMHPPHTILSQFNDEIIIKTRKTYEDATVTDVKQKITYSGIETAFFIGLEHGESDAPTKNENSLESLFGDDEPTGPVEKDIEFLIVCNEGKPSRYPILKSAILDSIQNVEIYGKWDERVIGTDPRFKGPLEMIELQKKLPRVKYTYCIPIRSGWATAKFWEMIHFDIIPFVHPSYDAQNNIGFPKFLRVKNSNDLFEKIKFLEVNPDAYKTLLTNLKELINPKYRTGEFINNTIMQAINEPKV